MLSAVAAQTSPPPSVWAVYVSGSQWTQSFKDHVAATYPTSSATYGVGGPSSPHQPWGTLPWVNIDRISATFTANMRVEADDLRVLGVNVAETAAASVAYDAADATATWTLDRPLRADRIIVELDGGPDGIKHAITGGPLDGDADGVWGGDFRLRINVLPGGSSVVVDHYDFAYIRRKLMTSPSKPGVGAGSYSIFADLNGDGGINVIDLMEVRARQGDRLPFGQPTAASSAIPTSPLRTRPVARSLFSSTPVLA
jgi:hypothetical protein